MTERVFSDEDLTLFLDGEASQSLSQEIEETVLRDMDLAARLNDMRAAQDAFVAAQEALLSLAPPKPTLPERQTASSGWMPAIGGLAAGLAIATVLSWSILGREDPDWRDVVANYQSLYVTETLAGAAEQKSAADAKLNELSGVLGLDLTNLPVVEGLDYKRAQQLGYKGKPLAQLTYLTADGGPVALCILYVGGPNSSIEMQTLEGMSAFSWVDDGYGVLLIGPYGDTALPEAATVFRKALQGGAA